MVGIHWLVAAVSGLAAQDAPEKPAPIPWQADLIDAFATAGTEQKPLAVFLLPADEEAAAKWLEALGKDEDFAKVREHFLFVAGTAATHQETVLEAAGLTRRVCESLGTVACAEHQAVVDDLRELLPRIDEFPLPQTLLFDPAHALIAWRATPLTAAGTVGLMKKTLAASNIDPKEYTPTEHTPDSDRAWFAEQMTAAAKEPSVYDKRSRLDLFADRPSPTLRQLYLETLEGSDDVRLRVAVIEALTEPHEVTLLEPLLEALEDGDEHVSLAAADALRVARLPQAAEKLVPLLKRYRSGLDHGRVVMALAACAGGDAEVAETIRKEAKQYDPALRCYGLMALGYLPEDAAAGKMVEKALGDRVTRIRAAGIWAAGQSRRADLEQAVAKVAKRERVVDLKELAADALQRIQDPEFQAEPADERSWAGKVEDHCPLDPPWD